MKFTVEQYRALLSLTNAVQGDMDLMDVLFAVQAMENTLQIAVLFQKTGLSPEEAMKRWRSATNSANEAVSPFGETQGKLAN